MGGPFGAGRRRDRGASSPLRGSLTGGASSHRRRRRRVVTVAGGGAAALLAAAGGATWYYAGRITESPHRRPVPPVADDEVTVVRRRGDEVVLRGPAAARPGWWGVATDRGYLRVGPPRPGDADDEVVRPVTLAVGPEPAPGTLGRFDGDAVPDDPRALDLPAEEVVVDGPLGPLPAWWVPGSGSTAAIVVHGRSGSRREGLRWVPTLHAAGLPTLVVSYRNDPDAPPSPDGCCHLGATEWEDVEAALRWALDHGARDAILLGISMGGACAAELLARSDLAPAVRGLVLDAPVRHWAPVLRAAAAERGLPPVVLPLLLPPTMAIAGARRSIDWRGLDHLDAPGSYGLPTLLFHGTADRTVPVALSDAFAALRPDVVTYHRVPGAGHIQSWNVDRDEVETALRRYLEGLGVTVTDGPARR